MVTTATTRSTEKDENDAEDADAPTASRRINFLGSEDDTTAGDFTARDLNSDWTDPKVADDAAED